ncbi:sperm flagellar protein 2-like [Heteronotia binoei]|uniref:sperm flagellar protein 2-like n=1 Tax=Heteronotia binoei TaxID=13085 RepID=UPI00292DA576|nr:sperm flagellar protein 2-like [Heteronotia binoei]
MVEIEENTIMTGEWCPPEDISANKPPPSNPILGHVIYRMRDLEQISASNKSTEPSEEGNDLTKFSIRAQLGAAAETLLKRGRNIPDELLIGILVEDISRLPPDQGWIINGFPMTLNQAKLLEKALTGRDPDQPIPKDASVNKPTLVVDPTAPKELPVFPPALDFAVLLEVSDSTVLDRVTNRKHEFSEISFFMIPKRRDEIDASLQAHSEPSSLKFTPDH